MLDRLSRLALIVTFLGIILSSECKADSFSFSQRDKQLHLIGSYALNLSLYKIINRYIVDDKLAAIGLSTLTTIGIGFAKELTDTRFSGGDMNANLIGAGLGAGFVFVFDL